ncbi:CDP-diacylglycerol--glycerol-3-phosphate 3-phosphatidyltransferase [Serinicoccus hydrothermalis]|uniref:CDP-diacylglycerol--glycerol-3-phosphate 3-phosphatidyltransferase n=1 Tax=Serinicoccus hydrothermalis TaxID=1758689 RepID=A0A1B1NGI6_9MICO|nr:CDP-diacylglycerol--glycerol-3-phosphate 3-phosphatidyltransferase [Serinicoccus hydrothermalis]ANS80532.1 CDP-diacylglycerol--glycerol-3-phosphate 3-phosphatidyltransferase [Serinicoccus hydrothermalis]
MIGPHDPDGPEIATAAVAERVSSWNLPNALTVLRILLVPLFGWLLLSGGGEDVGLRWWALVVFLVAIGTDWVDGHLARKHALITSFGKLMDPIADKALIGMALIGLSLLSLLPWWVTVVILVREVAITLMRFVVIRRGVIPASRGGKLKTVLQSIGIAVVLAPLGGVVDAIGVWVMYAAAVVTVVTGVDYVRQAFARPSSRS